MSRTRSEAAGAGQGHGWTRSSQRGHRTGRGPGRADKEGGEPRAGDAGPLTGDMRLTGSRATAGARAREESVEAGDSDKADYCRAPARGTCKDGKGRALHRLTEWQARDVTLFKAQASAWGQAQPGPGDSDASERAG